MFRIQNNVPEVYPDKSRDFQMFCRLFDVAFNSVKQSIDTMENITDTMSCDAVLLPLLKDKLGFFSSFELSDTELRYVLQAFPTIIRYKGSQQAITYITNLYSRLVSPISSAAEVELRVDNGNYTLEVSSEKAVAKTQLLFELLKYVLPTGYTIDYFVTEYEESQALFGASSKLVYGDTPFIQLLNSASTNCSYLSLVDDMISCSVDGVTYFPRPHIVDNMLETSKSDKSSVLRITESQQLAFYTNDEITHYLDVRGLGSDITLKVVPANSVLTPTSLAKFVYSNGRYVLRNTPSLALGMKSGITRIVIKKDVSTESSELANIVGSAVIV